MSILDPEYDGEIVTLGIQSWPADRVGASVDSVDEQYAPRWHPWVMGETAISVATLFRDGANHVRPTSATRGGRRGVEEIIMRDGRYLIVPWGGGREAERDLGTDRAAAVAHLYGRLASLNAGFIPQGQMRMDLGL